MKFQEDISMPPPPPPAHTYTRRQAETNMSPHFFKVGGIKSIVTVETASTVICSDYIKKYSRPIGFLCFYRPINIILSADWSDYIKDITRRLPKSVPKLYNRPIVGRRSADTSADDKW